MTGSPRYRSPGTRQPPEPHPEKAPLRRHFRALRRKLTPTEQHQHATAVFRHLLNSGLFWRPGRIAAYAAARGELDTRPVLRHVWQQQRAVALPVIEWSPRSIQGELGFYRVDAHDPLISGAFGLPTPATEAERLPVQTLAVLLVPLVAFDALGMRLGQGGGYYDRVFALLDGSATVAHPGRAETATAPPAVPRSGTALRIGLAHACQRASEPLPHDAWDRVLDAVVTEAGITAFSSRGRRLLNGPRPLPD